MELTSSQKLASYVDALRPIIYIHSFDFQSVDRLIESASKGFTIYEYNEADGYVDFFTKARKESYDLGQFLQFHDDNSPKSVFIVLKDVHHHLDKPDIIARLKSQSLKTIYQANVYVTVFLVNTKLVIPPELEAMITVFDIPFPQHQEIITTIKDYAKGVDLSLEDDVAYELAVSFRGLSNFEIRQILNLAYQETGTLEKKDKVLILNEKEQIIKKSGLLEIIQFNDSLGSIGGLEKLKEYLTAKAQIFNNLGEAKKFGIDLPKGLLIVGMPGCGKSLTAKATANLFQVPLLRLDIGKLMGKYVGESEDNLRKAIKTAEAVSPCVLWIDELEKAFAGVGGTGGGSDITTRLFGNFLTWLQEKESSVYVLATSNDVSKLPPEFLRKGRFDELFLVELPQAEERRKIFEIHLKKRGKFTHDIDTIKLLKSTDGYSGADIEAVVKEVIEAAFVSDDKTVTTAKILKTISETKSISVTLKDKIDDLKKIFERFDFKSAN
ncbi:AAA family ATPase [Thiothrix subterranea]|uniref:AAA family ATPase n=1 Tax=Thiothrix subterranea TaxID=2735563 RepID=UPI00192C2D6D|nr:AAA family ATPase [Thiothrix subterranea]QQZ28942.1 AAA family ATPase [Thiothrix subterranea]